MLDEAKTVVADNTRIYATPDHTPATVMGRTGETSKTGKRIMPIFTEGCKKYKIRLFDLDDPRQGIVHIVCPEIGLSLPGMTIACGDSHTCTHGALGTLSIGLGTTQLYHAMTTSCIIAKKPKTMRIRLEGKRRPEISAMDIILFVLSKLGIEVAVGYAVEFSGSVVREMSMEDRFTLCNFSVEMGAEYGLISPDEKTIDYIQGREFAPQGEDMDKLIAHCHEIASDKYSVYDKDIVIDITNIERQISWGINTGQVIGISGTIPDAKDQKSDKDKDSFLEACSYMDLKPGQNIRRLKVDHVFIGSCANGRLSNLVTAADAIKGRKVARGVKAVVVPGSMLIKQAAETMGLDKIFSNAGFIWGCRVVAIALVAMTSMLHLDLVVFQRQIETLLGDKVSMSARILQAH